MSKKAAAKIAPRLKNRSGKTAKTPLGLRLNSSSWYSSASQSIAIGRGGDNRRGQHWVRDIGQTQD